MKVLLINGSPHEHGCTYTALCEVADTLKKHDIESETLYLGKKPIAGCIACGKCAGSGRCVFDDPVNRTLEKLDDMTALLQAHRYTMRDLPDRSARFWTGFFTAREDGWTANWERPWYPAAGAAQARLLTA